MRVQMKKVRSSLIVGAAAFMAVAAGLACSESSFQPITEGAQPWVPHQAGMSFLLNWVLRTIDSGTCKGCNRGNRVRSLRWDQLHPMHVRRTVLARCGVPERDSLFWQRFSAVQLDPVSGLALALASTTD